MLFGHYMLSFVFINEQSFKTKIKIELEESTNWQAELFVFPSNLCLILYCKYLFTSYANSLFSNVFI